jgi:iron complex outermembrane recepter protein
VHGTKRSIEARLGRITMTTQYPQSFACSALTGHFLVGVSALALLAMPRPSLAQTAAPQDAPATEQSGIQDIVVTAQKRSQNLQNVPIAITAFTPETLAQKGINDVSQLGKFAPSVEIVGTSPFSGSTQVLSAFIRGIGQNDFAFNLDPDGVYFARTVGAVVDLLDLERVEILKGPQGTLFGRNTIGGAISVVTRDPGTAFSGQGEFTYGRFNRVDIRGAVDIPLIEDKLFAQVSFSSKSRDGYFKFLTFPGTYQTDVGRFVRPDDTTYGEAGGGTTRSFRAKLKWNASPDVTVRLVGDYMNANDQSTGSQLLKVQPGLVDVYNTCITTSAAILATTPLAALCNGPRGLPATPAIANQVLAPLGGANVDADPSNDRLVFDNRFKSPRIDTSYATGAGYSKVKTYGFSGTLDARLSDGLSIKSITAYRNLDSRFALDVDGSPVPMGDHAFTMNQWQFSQEVQLLGSFVDDRLKTVVGGYFFTEKGQLTDFVHFAGGLLQIYGPNQFKTDSYAGFAQADFKVTDRLGLTGGLRYTRDQKQFAGQQRDLNSLANKLGFPLALQPDPTDTTLYFPAGTNKLSFNNLSFKAGINYQITDRVLTYATYSQGFKSGGWTTRATVPILSAPVFNPEKADTFEIGVKGQFLDRKLQTNIAGYFTKYKDLQVTVYSGISPVTVNAAQADIKGIEAEVILVPTDPLTLSATLGYTDAKYTRKDAGTILGDKFINTPKFAASFNVDYIAPLSSGASVLVHGDYSYKSSIARDGENTPELITPATNQLGALVSYRAASKNWHADVGVTNLTDERFIVSGQNQSGIGYIGGTYNRPREWYLRVGFKL